MLAHGAVTLQSQIFTGAQLEAIARDYRQAGLAPAEVAMMAFAEKVAGNAYTVTAADVEALRRHGFSDTEVLDIAFAAAARGGHTLYSHVVTVEGRRMIFVAGQLARDKNGNVVGKGDMRAQIRQVGENIKAALAAAGATLADVVKSNTYVTDMDEYFRHVDVRMEYLGPAMPTSTTVEVRRLAHPDFLVEIEVVAMTG